MIKFLLHFKNRDFARLFFAQMISQFGDRIHQMALIGLIFERTGAVSAMGLAKLLSFTIIPVFVIGPIAGAYVDRWDRKTTLFVCDFLRVLLVLLIPMMFMDWDTLIPIYIIVFLVFSLSRFYVPSKMSYIPDLVETKHLIMANSLMTVTGMIAFVLGASLGGFIVEIFGARQGFVLDAITFFISGLFILNISRLKSITVNREKMKDAAKVVRQSIWVDIKEGLNYLIAHKEIRFIINIFFVLLSAAGAVYVVIIIFIQQAFGSVTKDLGILAIALGTGLFLGAVSYGKVGHKFRWHTIIFFCLVLGGVMISAFAFFVQRNPSLALAGVLALVMGLVIGPIFIASNTVAQLVSSEEMKGKVFTALEVVIHFAFLLTMFLSSWLSEFIQPFWILMTVGCIVALVGLAGLFGYKSDLELAIDPN